jgi:topoisomerase-4 subunit A
MLENTLNPLVLHTYAEDSYLAYAMATVMDRSLPDVRDGEKPVQRRILFAMRELGLVAAAKPVKSARVVGDVLGKYHPHGDTAAYDAMVRMAQSFMLRYPLIEGQGNFGSRDGDRAAAMRYTEARLSPISELLLGELYADTVDFGPNYDGTQHEPVVLPARLPILLLNGTMGIAVGMASDIPPHNLREVAEACVKLAENPETTLEEVLESIQGPDFPEGGQLVSSKEEIHAVYSAGRGSLRCRARWVKEELARGQWQIVITQLPYQVSTRVILEQIAELTNPTTPPNKKSITQIQGNLKQVALEFLETAVDESNKDAHTRLVLTPRTAKVDSEAMMAFLVANTSLEENTPVNMTYLALDGSPGRRNLLTVLQEWSTFRLATIHRRTAHELEVARKRIHLLEGRVLAFNNLDAIVRIIRAAEDPRAELVTNFGLSEIQADDILEMKLRQLNRLEGTKLEKELAEVRAEETRLTALLASEPALRKLMVQELKADSAKYADDRRTLIKPQAKAVQALVQSVVEEKITIVVSKNLWVKAYKGHALPAEGFTFKAGDAFGWKVEGSTVRPVVVIDTNGRVYTMSSATIPSGRGEGAPLGTFIELQDGAKPFQLLSGSDEQLYLFAGQNGYGFTAPMKGLIARPKAGKAFLALDSGEHPLPCLPLSESDVSGYVAAGTAGAKVLIFSMAELASRPSGGKGVMLMAADEEKLTAVLVVSGQGASIPVTTTAGKPASVTLTDAVWSKLLSKRGRKGAYLPKKEVLAG